MAQPTFFKIASRQFWPLFTGIFTLVGAIFTIVALGLLWNEQQYVQHGFKADAQIVEKYTGRGSKGRTIYYVRYEFQTGDGVWVTGQDQVGNRTWNRLREGEKVQVEYLAERPEKNRLVGESENRTVAIIFVAVGGSMLLIAGFFFSRSLKRVSAALRLWREGVRVEANVDEVKETNVSFNRVRQWRVHYSYHDYSGQLRAGQSDYMPPNEARDWNAGDRGVVRYDQNQPASSVWVGREDGS